MMKVLSSLRIKQHAMSKWPNSTRKASPCQNQARIACKMPHFDSAVIDLWKKGHRIGDNYYFVKRDGFHCGPPSQKFYHVAAKGSKKCKHGVGPAEDNCEVAGKKALKDKDDETIKMKSGSWDQGPPAGCSIGHSSSWGVTYNRKDGGDKNGDYYPVCESTLADLGVELSEPERKICHLTAKGAKSCDFGFSPGKGDCREKADEALQESIGVKLKFKMHVVREGWMPAGCFTGNGGRGWFHFFNLGKQTRESKTKFSLVCCV